MQHRSIYLVKTYSGRDGVKLVKATSPLCVSSFDLLPGFVDLNVLVAMARDVEDGSQSIADSGGTFQRRFDDSVTLTADPLYTIYFSRSTNMGLSTSVFYLY